MDRIETVKAFAAALEARDFEKSASFTFKGDKIASLASDNVPGGGVLGVLAQIGALPQM